jgi:hypothetical protein
MYFDQSSDPPRPAGTPVLAVVDWTVDPHAVVAALSRRATAHESSFGLLVPAWLHGIDWVGDPTASVPCAERQLATLVELCDRAGLEIGVAAVGDPDPITATVDMLRHWDATGIVLCTGARHFTVPPVLGLASRLRRATGLPVAQVSGVRPGRAQTLSDRPAVHSGPGS